ncbi:MAG: universal stress protein [Planctomycetaceae bacterium]
MIPIRRILVPTDFSKFSESALRYGCEFADRFDAELHVLHVVWNPLPPGPENWGRTLHEYDDDIREAAGRDLQKLDVAPLSDRDRVLSSVRVGVPMPEIILYARAKDVDLIVIGTHGRTGLPHVLMGSVAEKVVRKAPCPVLTVRRPEHKFVMP